MPNHSGPDPSSNSGSSPSPRTPVRRFMRLIGYNVLSAVILFGLIELGLRIFGFEFALAPPRIEFGYPSPQIMEKRFLPDPDLLWIERDYSMKVAGARKSRLRLSMVFMGDSNTRDKYERQLRSIIEERFPGSDFTYLTLGTHGWSSWSGLQQLQRDVLPLRPRAITIFYGWNDHWNYFGLQDKDVARILHSESSSRPSALFSRLRTVQLVNRAFLAHRELFAEPGQARVSPDDFRANLRQMVRIARDNDIIPILFTAPTSHEHGKEPSFLTERWLINLEDLVPLHRQYVRIVQEVAAAENAPIVDLYHEFNQLPRQDLKNFFRRDGIHFRPAGHRKIAELIDRFLDQAGLYPEIMNLSRNRS